MEVARRTVLAAPAAVAAAAASPLPQVPFGKISVSRLLVGGNPISGFSHQSRAMDEEMMDYVVRGISTSIAISRKTVFAGSEEYLLIWSFIMV